MVKLKGKVRKMVEIFGQSVEITKKPSEEGS